MSEVLKKCNGCGKIKPLSDFPIDRSRKDGRFHWCFDCNKKKASERRKKIKHLDIENVKLKVLLKECLPIVSAEIMSWQIRGGEESRKRGQDLLTRINTALGESEEHSNMLKNADNFNTSGGNVKENNR